MVIYWNSNVNIIIFWDTDFRLSWAVSSNPQNKKCNESKIYESFIFWNELQEKINFFTIFKLLRCTCMTDVISLKPHREYESGHVPKYFYKVLLKWCLLNIQRAVNRPLKLDNLTHCFVYLCRTRPTDPGAMSPSQALCLSLHHWYSPQYKVSFFPKSPFLSQNGCITGRQWALRVESLRVCSETAQHHLSPRFPGPAWRTALNWTLWPRAFCLKTGNGSWDSREKTWLSENPDYPRHCRVRKWRSMQNLGWVLLQVDIHGNVF